MTSSYSRTRNLDAHKYQHPSNLIYCRLKGSKTPKSAFYPEPVCEYTSHSLYPSDVPLMLMSVAPVEATSHVPREEGKIFAGVHKLIDRKDEQTSRLGRSGQERKGWNLGK